ncbi:MAG: radical SAM protein [Bryobacteraceae bacterium]
MAQQLVGIAKLAAQAPALLEKRAVVYRQLASYNLLNRCSSERMPFEWTINPYRGCEFACQYCYARYTHEFLELRDPHEFETRIFAKQWNPADFRVALRKVGPRERVAIGTATDPYQPAERRYLLTRSILEVLAEFSGRSFALTTKGNLVCRDVDLLARIAKRNQLVVSLTITTVDPDLARKLEPRAPRPDLRLEAVRTLRAAGVPVGVACSPLLPLINDAQEQLDALAAAASDAGARWMGANVLFLTEGPRQVFFEFLEREFPELLGKYRERFGRSVYLRGSYVESVRKRARAARERYGLGEWAVLPPAEDAQMGFVWE